ncbi:MAG: AAA family ATPase [Ignavibacteriaceae bacterium]|nr:AAA family ATPase [Ignavibacteriaceae bacterium]
METSAVITEGRDLRGVATILWRRRWVLLAPALAGLLTGIVVGHPSIMRPLYRASATILLEFPQPVSRDLQGILPVSSAQEQLPRLQSLMQSNEFLLKVADQSGLRDDPGLRRWVEKSRKQYPDMTIEELQDLRLTQWLREAIRTARGRAGENVVVITVADYYPDRAREIAQNLTTGVIEANRSSQLERVRSLHDFSLEQLVVYKQRLSEAEQRLQEFQRGVASVVVNAGLINESNVAEARRLRSEASAALDRLGADRDARRTALEAKSTAVAAMLRGRLGAPWSSLFEEIRDLERAYAEATLTPGPRVGQGKETAALVIARKIDEVRDAAGAYLMESGLATSAGLRDEAVLAIVAEARAEGAASRLATFDALLDSYQARVSGTSQTETTLRRLTQEVETNRTLYNAFVQQIASSQISEAFEATKAAGRLTVLEPASRPMKPFKPNRVAVAVLSTIIGLALGIGALALIERHDLTFRDARETERALGLRVIGTLPQVDLIRKGARNGSFVWDGVRLATYLHDSPAFQEMRRVALELRSEADGLVRSLLITSARGGEGKSTTCVLLGAAAAAEDPHLPVLLVDLDFRRGALGRVLGLSGEDPGVIKALEVRRIEEPWFQRTSLPNLHVLPLGGHVAPRNDLLTYENLSWLLPELTRRYGFVIVDSPPNVPVADALIIGQLVDAVLIVLKAGSTPRHLVERGVELQKQFTGNVRGLLMNNVEELMPYYYNHRYYGYRYGKRRTS